jgi:hypothetical protein
MLEVFVYGCLLRAPVLLQHGCHTTASLCRLAVHGLVELGIASMVFLFKRNRRHGGDIKRNTTGSFNWKEEVRDWGTRKAIEDSRTLNIYEERHPGEERAVWETI